MKTRRIMVAETEYGMKLANLVLAEFDLVQVSTLQAAEYQCMEDGIDLFIINIHFDDSRALDLVSFIRKDKKHKQTPIILVRLRPTEIGESLIKTANALVKIGTVSQYLELDRDPNAQQKLKSAVNNLLPARKKK